MDGSGGDIHLRSGTSRASNSGSIGIMTPNGGHEGRSGEIGVFTGTSFGGDSGGILIKTGHASGKRWSPHSNPSEEEESTASGK
jgi:hypothetical protein